MKASASLRSCTPKYLGFSNVAPVLRGTRGAALGWRLLLERSKGWAAPAEGNQHSTRGAGFGWNCREFPSSDRRERVLKLRTGRSQYWGVAGRASLVIRAAWVIERVKGTGLPRGCRQFH